jgi:hypothetical protein
MQKGHAGILLYLIRGNLSNCERGPEGILLYPIRGNIWQSKTCDIELTFVKACSDLWAIHQRKCKEW